MACQCAMDPFICSNRPFLFTTVGRSYAQQTKSLLNSYWRRATTTKVSCPHCPGLLVVVGGRQLTPQVTAGPRTRWLWGLMTGRLSISSLWVNDRLSKPNTWGGSATFGGLCPHPPTPTFLIWTLMSS